MDADKVMKVAKFSKHEEVWQWENNVKRFVDMVHSQLATAMKTACDVCPFRNNISAGGCCGKDCPVFAVIDANEKAVKRAEKSADRIYEARKSLKERSTNG